MCKINSPSVHIVRICLSLWHQHITKCGIDDYAVPCMVCISRTIVCICHSKSWQKVFFLWHTALCLKLSWLFGETSMTLIYFCVQTSCNVVKKGVIFYYFFCDFWHIPLCLFLCEDVIPFTTFHLWVILLQQIVVLYHIVAKTWLL